MIRSLAFLVISTVTLITGCGRSSPYCTPRQGVSELRLLKLDKASKDAEIAYKSGDHRLLGVYGISVDVPGLSGNPYDHKNEIRMLDGTGDAYCTNEEHVLNHNARLYAKKYNDAMLDQLHRNASNQP